MDCDVIIVGAGHNGLVAGAYLARVGLKVRLLERRPFVGGGSITQEIWPGFRFMPCAHMTHGLHPKVIRDLGLRERGLRVIPRTFLLRLRGDGTYYSPADHSPPRNIAAHLSDEEALAKRRYEEFKRTLRGIFAPYRLRVPPSLDEVRRKVAGTPAATVLEQALTTPVRALQDVLLPTDRLRDWVATETGAFARDPLALALAYWSLDDYDDETGESPPNGYVVGGMGALSALLADAAREAGAEIRIGREVERFLVEGDRVVGVRLADGEEIRSRVVVSSLDPKRTFLRLLGAGDVAPSLRRAVEGIGTGVSSLKLLAVISELPRWRDWDGDPDLPSTGSVVLSATRAEIDAAYADLAEGQPPRAPVIGFSVPSVADPSLAPPGYHTASCWIYPAASRLARGTWDDVRARVAESVIDQITRHAPNFRASIREVRLRTPLDMERENALTDGCIWHAPHTAEHLFWNRPLPELADYRAPIAGLYLCGAGQHPGGEVSGAPGHNAAQEILKDLGRVG